MDRRFAILAVCTANICRSPMIELLARRSLDPRRFEVASAGTHGWMRAPMDSMAAMEAMRLGLEPEHFRSHPIDSYLVDSAELVLTATRAHRSEVLAINPQALRKTFTVLEFAGLLPFVEADSLSDLVRKAALVRSRGPADADIEDPYRRAPDVHRTIADQIDVAVGRISDVLNRVGAPGHTA